MKRCECRNESGHEGRCSDRDVIEYPTAERDDYSMSGDALRVRLCRFCRRDCWAAYFAEFPIDDAPESAPVRVAPIDESPSYRASMKEAGRSHLLRW